VKPWEKDWSPDPLEAALAAEGATGKFADVVRSMYQQESSSGKNTKTSNAGAVGPMQVIPTTFSSVADKGWDIKNEEHNLRAGIRYAKQGFEASGGDPALTGAFYYGGPGGLEKARRGVAVSDPRNPDAPTTLQYGQQVAARVPKEPLNPVMAAGKAVTDAVIPSAIAAEPAAQPKPWEKEWEAPAQPAAQPKQEGSSIIGTAGRILANTNPVGMALNAIRGPGLERDAIKGLVRGTASMGNTIINAGTKAAADAMPTEPNQLINPDFQRPQQTLSGLITGKKPMSAAEFQNSDRQAGLDAYDAEAPKNLAYQGGKLTSEIAGTLGVGGAIAAPLKAVAPALPLVGNAVGKFANAVQSGGMTVGGAPAATIGQGAGNLVLRAAGGAVNGGASAGVLNPDDAGTGAALGAALPVATKVAGTVGKAVGRGLSGGGMSDEVKALAVRAKELGIDIPADRLVDSKPLNAVASSLEYVPLSGRTATMRKMQDQLNRAVTRTFGQDSDNVTLALRKASDVLGAKFDEVLTKTKVNFDPQFMQDIADSANRASRELGTDGAKIISNQVDDIIAKAASGQIDGQAAYNIKKTLDEIGRRNSSEAFYAIDLKKKLMDALNRSLGPEEAKAFAQTRKQYGNMLSLEKLAANGVEGDLSIARLANMKNINNAELQELADISAQFLKSREGAHGAAQRTILGTGALVTGGATGTLPAIGAGMAVGRGANMLLNSGAARNALLGQPQSNSLLRFAGEPDLAQMFYRAAPVAGTSGP
jgi:hypothetical protein